MTNKTFGGFIVPESNWFRMPNNWTDIMHGMTSMSEIKVVMYILRHTWGYREFGKSKKITLDEFIYGRKKNDGTRIDQGTGLSRQSVIDGLKKAINDNYLTVEKCGEDKGRLKHFYGLKMKSDVSNIFTPEVQHLDRCGLTPRPRTEKETNRKKPTSINRSRGDRRAVSQKSPNTFITEEFDRKAAGHLREVLIKHDSDLVRAPRAVSIASLIKCITSLRIDRKVPKEDILDMLNWMDDYYDVSWKMFKKDSLSTDWEKFKLSKQRWENKSSNGSSSISDATKKTSSHKNKMAIRQRVLDWLVEKGYIGYSSMIPSPSNVKQALKALGEKPDAVTEEFVTSGGCEE